MVLGCTEIPLLLKQEDCDLPLFDTLAIHAEAAVDFALGPPAASPRFPFAPDVSAPRTLVE